MRNRQIKKFKTLFLSLMLPGLFIGCGQSDDDIVPDPEVPGNPVTPGFLNLSITTNMAAYNPGDEVTFTIDNSSLPSGARVRYKHLDSVIEEAAVSGTTWKWQTPSTDFRGYIAEVYTSTSDTETIYATIGVDVSSDWTKFPRYGFLSKFHQLSDAEMAEVIANLNRHHINGLQFYDWHNKHHQPLPVINHTPATSWKDIINRDIYFSTVEKYIAQAHSRNMKAMFYNLIYGAWKDAEADGTKKEWYVYTDNTHTNRDFHPLPAPPFLSNIFLLDPSNSEWQQYLAKENQKVYEHLNIELGEHMLGKEYFPNNNLAMKPDLKNALIGYYDFLVAYQNLLRDGGSFNLVSLSSLDGKLPLSNWPASRGSVATVCRKVSNKQVVHFINFKDSKTSNWRDNQGIQAIPALVKDAQITMTSAGKVKKIWTASPDLIGGASRLLNFEQSGNQVAFTLPELKYWSMVVVEYE